MLRSKCSTTSVGHCQVCQGLLHPKPNQLHLWQSLSPPSNLPQLFQVLYFLSTFFGQLGPNATTFLLPSELFPTEVRTVAHGFSAAAGKLGALFAASVEKFAVQSLANGHL